jgi:hypothetical protein
VTPSRSHVGPSWKRAAVDCTDETRIHLRDRAGIDLDRAALGASLRFRRGLGAKSICKVKGMQHRRDPGTIEIETHWVKRKVRHPVRHQKLRLGTLAANGTRFRSKPMAGPALGEDNVLSTSVKFEEPIESHTVTSIACRAMSSLVGRCRDLG